MAMRVRARMTAGNATPRATPGDSADPHWRTHRRNRWKALTRRELVGGRPAVVKDGSVWPRWFQRLIGTPLLRREYGLLSRLGGLDLAPRPLGWVSGAAFATEWMEMRPLLGVAPGELDESVLDQLCAAVAAIHQRGVTHGDLHNRNVMLTPENEIRLVDFATGMRRESLPALGWRYATQLDWLAVGKICRDHWPHRYGDPTAPWHQPAPWGLRGVRRLVKLRRERHRAARRAAKGGSMSQTPGVLRKLDQPLEFLKVLVAWGLLVGIAVASHPTRAEFFAGSALFVVGQLIRVWAAGHLQRNNRLATDGPYAYVRDPLYLGRLLWVLGVGCFSGYFSVAILLVALFLVYYMRRKVPREMRRLENLFGDEYQRYCQQVRSLWPRLTPYPHRAGQPWRWSVFLENKEHLTVIVVVAVIMWFGWRTLA